MKLAEVQVLHCVPCSQEELLSCSLQTKQTVCSENKRYHLYGKNRAVKHPLEQLTSTIKRE